MNVCNCTIGPPPWPEKCNACGASSGYVFTPGPPFAPQPFPIGPQYPSDGRRRPARYVTEDDVRRIVREEIAKSQEPRNE